MKDKTFRFMICCAVIATVSGCNTINGFAPLKTRMGIGGPIPLDSSAQDLHLKQLFDPYDKVTDKKQFEGWDQAFAAFQKEYKNEPEDTQRALRNAIQERILYASDQRCGEYKTFLKQFDTDVNISLGWLTTATAGAGAIALSANTVRVLSGLAAIFSGFRAEVNEAVFNRLTVQVITNGIEATRKDLYKTMLERRKATLADYPVQAALRDSAAYHYHCSLISGLEYAALAVERADNPGLKQIKAVLTEIGGAREVANQLSPPTSLLVQDEAIFPLIMFNRANESYGKLKNELDILQKLSVIDANSLNPTPPQGISDDERKERQNRLEKLKSDIALVRSEKTKLDQDVQKLLKANEETFKDTEKQSLDKLQTQWVSLFVQEESEQDPQRKLKFKVDALSKQLEAKEKRKEYQDLNNIINGKISAVKDLADKIRQITKRAAEF